MIKEFYILILSQHILKTHEEKNKCVSFSAVTPLKKINTVNTDLTLFFEEFIIKRVKKGQLLEIFF